MTKGGNLKPAHSGYRYQDIACAFFLLKTMLHNFQSVTIDKKIVDDDRLDDLELLTNGERSRIQIKSSPNNTRRLSFADFNGKTSSLRIDRLVLTQKRDRDPVKDFRLCATWLPAESTDQLAQFLKPLNANPSIDQTATSSYKLEAEEIWPKGDAPKWPALKEYIQKNSEFNQEDFYEFCNKFTIELELPLASKNLLIPGPLESSLLRILTEQVGIGRYPNQGRLPEDVAALAVSLSNLARTQELTLTPKEVAKNLEIRTDFGHVSQSFPVETNHFFNRPETRNQIRSNLECGGFHLLTAPPGSGKSWELTSLAEELSSEFVVARHYCYLEPGDELIERRVTSDVFFANLLSELHKSAPQLSQCSYRLFADLSTLEETLNNANDLGLKIVLIIDGLDHISRVRGSSGSLSDEETDIIEKLTTLALPANTTVVLGSQPGEHLASFVEHKTGNLLTYSLSPWKQDEIIELAKLHNVLPSLQRIGIADDGDQLSVLTTLAEKSDGNPLYARYLSRGLNSKIELESIGNPIDWINSAPPIDGDIALYYNHLYASMKTEARVVADMLGVLDFALSQTELQEMLPEILASYIPDALSTLQPILTVSQGQSGLRIFHESFRRYMLDEIESQGRSLSNVLKPAVDWLEQRGFYLDAKSFRFLLPALRRAHEYTKVISLVDPEFVSTSISHGHSVDAIQKNLAITADIAGRTQNWPVLVRCIELRRSLSTYLESNDVSYVLFWETYAAIYGAESLAERLLFDGKPTLDADEGLVACLLADKQGAVAPWREYLSLDRETVEERYGEDFDRLRQLNHEQRISIAIIQGRIRLGESWALFRRYCEFLLEVQNRPPIQYIRQLSAIIARLGYGASLKKIVDRSRDNDNTFLVSPAPYALYAIALGLYDDFLEQGDAASAERYALVALSLADSPDLHAMCLECGAECEDLTLYANRISTINIALGENEHTPNASNLRTWVSSLRLLATSETYDGVMNSELSRIVGVGWYRCWLRYVVVLATIESKKRRNIPCDIKIAFAELNKDTRPFYGSPRACDLYSIQGVIKESLKLGLSLLSTNEEWSYALDIITKVSDETRTRLDREDGGPITISTLFELIAPYASNSLSASAVQATISHLNNTSSISGTYYAYHAEFAMNSAKMQIACAQVEQATANWHQAGVYATSYGFHKDVTLYEILESAPSLAAKSNFTALSAISDLQPLVGAVLSHTDGRSTKRTPNTWFRSLLEVDAANAIDVLTRTIVEDDGIENWASIEAIEDVAEHILDIGDPFLIDSLWETLQFDIEYQDAGESVTNKRLGPLSKMFSVTPSVAHERLVRLAAQASGDAKRNKDGAYRRINDFASLHSSPIRLEIETDSKNKSRSSFDYSRTDKLGILPSIRFLTIAPQPSIADIMVGLRKVDYGHADLVDAIALNLGYLLDEMAENGDQVKAIRLLHFFARDIYVSYSSKAHPLSKIALYLENSGNTRLASIAYALAFSASRGGGGWHGFGDGSHKALLESAIRLDRDLSIKTIADEVAYQLRNIEYGAGITRSLIERLTEWGEVDVAVDSWREAYSVIKHRLPLASPNNWFAELNLLELATWTPDEGTVLLLLTRLSEPRLTRKVAALAGLLKVIKFRPDCASKPLAWWVTRDTPNSSLLLMLQLLMMAENDPFPISKSLHEELDSFARSESWGIAYGSAFLLNRAGFTLPKRVTQPPNLDHLPQPTEKQIEDVVSFGAICNLDILTEFWPKLPTLIARKHSEAMQYSISKERIGERFKLSYGRDGDAYPPTPVFHWYTELFLSALHEQACGIYEQLWQSGAWTKEAEFELFAATQPDLALHLAIFNSRVPRPSWDDPNAIHPGQGDIQLIPNDPAYPGWYRLGMIETQFINDDGSYRRPSKRVNLKIGSVLVPLGTTYPTNFAPFYPQNHDIWWRETISDRGAPPASQAVPILGIGSCSDWLGEIDVLIPPLELRTFGNLELPGFGEKLVWKDQSGSPILALRYWRVKSNQTFGESPSYVGLDLIASPEAIAFLEKKYARKIKEYRITDTRIVPNKGP